MSILRSFCPEPGGGTPRLKTLAVSPFIGEETSPSPAANLSRIDNLEALLIAPLIADCTRKRIASPNPSSMTLASYAMSGACKTFADRATSFQTEDEAIVAMKGDKQGIEWALISKQGKPVLCGIVDTGNEPANQSYLSAFMLHGISGVAPSHAQYCENCFEVACHLDCLHSSADLSTSRHALDAFCSETLDNVRGLKAPLLEQEQLLGFDRGWNMYDRGRYVETMVHNRNRAWMAMRQYSYAPSLGMTELFKQRNMSRSPSEISQKMKYLSDLVAQLLPLLLYSALVMVRPSHQAILLAWAFY